METDEEKNKPPRGKEFLQAIRSKVVKEVEAVLERGGRLNRPIAFKGNFNNGYRMVTRQCHYTPICTAISQGTEEILQLLVDKGADTHARSHHIEKGTLSVFEPMFLAADSKKLGMVEVLLKAGVDPNEKIKVLTRCQEEEGGSLTQYKHEGMCYLHFAAAYGSPQMMELFIKYGADSNLRSYDCLERPIRLIQHDDRPKLSALLAGGVDLSLESYQGTHVHQLGTLSMTLAEYFFSTFECGDSFEDMEALLELLHNAGYSFEKELKQNIRCIGRVMNALERNPRTLQGNCRLRIRKELGSIKFQEKLNTLHLPNPVKDYLSFRAECPSGGTRRKNARETEKAYLLPRDM